jgi:CheY-like chemotaxis protein
MPVMDGFELARRIKENTDLGEPTLMMLTSGGRRGDGARCRKLGISAYLMKPIKQSSLLDAIMTVLDHTRSRGKEPSPLVTRHTLRERKRSLKILLADDNSVNQKLTARLLEKRGHTVIVVENGKEALTAIGLPSQQPFNMILMDVQMPEMDGFEATAAIRQKESATGIHIPIIALTAHAMKSDREKCLEAGMDGYISKPIKSEELFAAIDELTPGLSKGVTTAKDGTQSEMRSDEACFDKQAALAHFEGDMDLFCEVVGIFNESHPETVSEIRDAIAEENVPRLARSAHALKGAIGNFGDSPAFATALKLEAIAQEGDIADAKEIFTILVREIECLKEALATVCKESGP